MLFLKTRLTLFTTTRPCKDVFNDRKSSQKNIVDMMYYGDHVFTINSYGTISIYKVDEKS